MTAPCGGFFKRSSRRENEKGLVGGESRSCFPLETLSQLALANPLLRATQLSVNPVTRILLAGIIPTSAKIERHAGLAVAPVVGRRGNVQPLNLPTHRWPGTPQLMGLLPVMAFSILWATP